MRIIFAGTPEFAAKALEALIQSEHEVVMVLSQPDRPAGRGRKLKESAVKALAKQHNAQPRVLCEAILNRTLRANGQSAQDDMTVLCARVQTSQTGW